MTPGEQVIVQAVQQWCDQRQLLCFQEGRHLQLWPCGLPSCMREDSFLMLELAVAMYQLNHSPTLARFILRYNKLRYEQLLQGRTPPLLIVSRKRWHWEEFLPLAVLELGDPTLFQQLQQLIEYHTQQHRQEQRCWLQRLWQWLCRRWTRP